MSTKRHHFNDVVAHKLAKTNRAIQRDPNVRAHRERPYDCGVHALRGIGGGRTKRRRRRTRGVELRTEKVEAEEEEREESGGEDEDDEDHG